MFCSILLTLMFQEGEGRGFVMQSLSVYVKVILMHCRIVGCLTGSEKEYQRFHSTDRLGK